MADKLSPELKEFIGELHEADYTTSQIKTILGEFDITVSSNAIRYQRPDVKERYKQYNQRPDVKAKKKSHEKTLEVKKHRREYMSGYHQRLEVKKRFKNTILKDLDIYIIDLFHTHQKLSVNEIAQYIRNMDKKARSEFMFIDLEKRIATTLEAMKEINGEDSPIIYTGDDIYEMNPSSSCWKIYEESLESTVED